jgi:hypothetical protein
LLLKSESADSFQRGAPTSSRWCNGIAIHDDRYACDESTRETRVLRMINRVDMTVRAALLRCYGDILRHGDAVALADGRVMVVPRSNLAAAKALHAAHKVAERRAAAGLIEPKPPRLLEKAV